MYGGITYEKQPDWQFKSRDLAIGNIIKVGRFARIYKATLYKKGKSETVVAKTLKGTINICSYALPNYFETNSIILIF